ncbi:MAG: 3-mercaptopyruvate sulfurtransferase [Betaproteobacteria bacterium RIFCSPLOWO2_12_FULL_62_13]|nr:MAG: 3-mercaptopyruvate sulfurtransferase [Betaproteobacteria bacterium RIFCSPLOWO2_12_FULL_62_13]
MAYTTLVTVETLARHLDAPDWVICDCRHELTNYHAGRRACKQSHIAGARFLHLDEDLSGPKTGANGRHPLPHPITLTLRLGALGIDNAKQVVAYDASGGSVAARLWWMLRWVGHARVAVLDGGWDAWIKAGQPVTAEPPAIRPTTFNPNLQPRQAVDTAFVAAHLNHPEVCVLDARSPERFRGENETLDPVAGHIPGAVNRFFKLNLDETGCFKPAAGLKREFTDLLGHRPGAGIVHQCGSGVTACHNLLAMEIAGLTGSLLYPGSWSAWVSDPSRPVAKGAV